MSQGTTPPGWYDDGSGARRWWDGTRWTEHTQPVAPPPGPPPAPGGYGHGPQPSGRGRKGLLLAVLGVVAALVLAGVLVAVVVLGGDDDSDDSDRAGDDTTSSSTPPTVSAPTPSTATVTPSAPEPEPEPSEPETSSAEPSAPAPDPADPGATTCGQIRAMTTEERLALLDQAARLEVERSGDEDAQAYLDLPASQRRAFAEFLPTACQGEPDSTQLDDIDDF